MGDHDHVARTDARRRAAARPPRSAPQCRRRAAPRGVPSSADRGDFAQARLRLSWLSIPRVCAAPPCVQASVSADLVEVLRGVDVERQRADLDDLGDRVRRPSRCSTWRWQLPSAERGRRSRPAASAAARWCRCRGGRGRSTPIARPTGRASSSSSCLGSSIGQSPGTSSTRSAPATQRVPRPRWRAATLWPRSCRRAPSRRSRRRSAGRRCRRSRRRSRSIDGARLQRHEHVGEHRLGQGAARAARRTRCDSRCLASAKLLIGRIATVRIGGERLSARVRVGRLATSRRRARPRTAASARRRGGARPACSAARRPAAGASPSVRSSATKPSITPS